MVNEEVENILGEIRERVRARELSAPGHAIPATENERASPVIGQRDTVYNSATAAIVESYLSTTARSWDRLPPIVSNRTGAIASCELWLKRQIKRMTRWFTWEQVNYNAAVHHALLSTLQAITHNEQSSAKRLSEIREEIRRAIADQAKVVQQLNAQLEATGHALRHELSQQKTQTEEQQKAQAREQEKAQIEQRSAQVAAQRRELDARLLALTQELNVRFEQLLEEQRVCFKQLSLEATEEAVLRDRARRKSDKLIEDLSLRIKELEKR